MKGKKILCGLVSGVLAFSVCAFTACGGGIEKDYAYVTEDLSEKNANELENLATYSAFYKPQDGSRVGDTMPFYENGVYHIFYLKDGGGTSSHPVYRVDTTDFVHYEEKGLVLPAGDSNSGESMIGTGSVVKHNNDYLFFYTGHPATGAETVRVAISEGNLDSFEKKEDFILSPADYGFVNDFRDPEVRWSEADECYYCIVSTRKNDRAVLAQFALSETLEVLGEPSILYTDTRGFNVLECPTYFEWNGRYYITYSAQDLNMGDTDDLTSSSYALSGSKGCMYYLSSENPFEGWRELANPQLDSKVFYAGKVARGSDMMLVGWAAQRDVNATYKYAWGGNLVAHKLVQNEDGVLSLTYPQAYASHFDVKQPLLLKDQAGEETDSLSLISSNSFFNPIANEKLEYRLSMNVNFSSDASEFGLVFGLKDNLYDAVKVTINPLDGKIKAQYGQNSEIASNFLTLEADTDYHIDVFVEGSNFVLYIEGVAFTFKVRNVGNRRIALFAQNGIVEFSDIAMFAPSENDLDFTGSFALSSGESKEFSITPQTDCYVSVDAAFLTSGETEIELLNDGKAVASASGKDAVSLYGYANVKAGKTVTVRVNAKENVTVTGAIDGAQTHYVPVRNISAKAKSENKGASARVENEGYASFHALVELNDKTTAGTLVVQKNGETVSTVEVKEGYAHAFGGVEAESGDTLSAFVDFNGEVSHYSLLFLGGATEQQSNLLPLGVNEREFVHSFDVEITAGNQSFVTAKDSFGEQGTNGFVYTYGKSIDEMKPCSNFNENADEEWDVKYTEPSASSDLEVKADWIKTGGHYSAGVTYIATKTATVEVSLGVKPTEAAGGYVLAQLYHNRNRVLEYLMGSDWDWRNDTVTLSLKEGDCISFAIRNAGYLSDDGAAAANYNFSVSDRNAVPNKPFADFTKDFSVENNAFNGWECGWVDYRWKDDPPGSIQGNTENTESFEYHKLTDKNGGGDGWAADGVEIKADWMSSAKYAAIVYTADRDMRVSAFASIRPKPDTKVMLRLVVTDSEGKCKFNQYNQGTGEWEQTWNNLSLDEGDKVYLIFTFEGNALPQTHFSYTLTEK